MIFAYAYDLQPYGFLVFQALKLVLWTVVTFTSIGTLVVATGHTYDVMSAPLLVTWYGPCLLGCVGRSYGENSDDIHASKAYFCDGVCLRFRLLP